MRGGRPRTAIGTYGTVNVRKLGCSYLAETRYRDVDGRLRRVTARCTSRTGAVATLKERLARRPDHPVGSLLSPASSFGELADLWLIDLEGRDISEGTKAEYRNVLRLHVTPAMEHYTLGAITTGRVEWFLKAERSVSYSRARMSRTILNQLFRYACARMRSGGTRSRAPRRWPSRRGGRRRSRWSRSRRSERRPLRGVPARVSSGRARTVRCET